MLSKKIGIVLLIFLCTLSLLGGAFFAIRFFFAPLDPSAEETRFVIVKGDSVAQVSQKLAANSIIRSPLSLRILVRLQGGTVVLQPGSYRVSAAMTPAEILTILESEAKEIWVTIPEGWRAEEIAEAFDQKLQERFRVDEFLGLAKTSEGMLFPDTYLLGSDATAESVYGLLTSTFEKRYAQAIESVGEGSLPKKDTISLAALLQREAKTYRDMQIVASVIMNRLKAGMPLQIDATLQYLKGYDAVAKTWWPVPKARDKDLEGLINTYKYPGLPPSPIANPGLQAIKAALKPASTSYLFYISDQNGVMYYANTYDEHKRNIDTHLR